MTNRNSNYLQPWSIVPDAELDQLRRLRAVIRTIVKDLDGDVTHISVGTGYVSVDLLRELVK